PQNFVCVAPEATVFPSLGVENREGGGAADEPHFSWRWKAAGGHAESQRRPGEREHRVGHCNIDMTTLPALIARTQRQQNIDHSRKTAARYVGREHRRHDTMAGWSGL